jgi:hypothetical protein
VSRELAPSEIERLYNHRNDAADVIEKLYGHIEWQAGQIEQLRSDLADEEADKSEAVGREESMRIDAEEQLKEAERMISHLREQIDYIQMGS